MAKVKTVAVLPGAPPYVAALPDDPKITVWFDGEQWGGDSLLAQAGRLSESLWYATRRATHGDPARLIFYSFVDAHGLRIVSEPALPAEIPGADY